MTRGNVVLPGKTLFPPPKRVSAFTLVMLFRTPEQVSTHSRTVGGSMHLVGLPCANKTHRRRLHLHHQLRNMCYMLSLQCRKNARSQPRPYNRGLPSDSVPAGIDHLETMNDPPALPSYFNQLRPDWTVGIVGTFTSVFWYSCFHT